MRPIILKKADLKSINWINEIKEYLVIQENGSPILVTSICKHNKIQLPRLIDGETCIKCPAHGWILNVQKAEYDNPIGIKQLSSEYSLETNKDLIRIFKREKVKKELNWHIEKKQELKIDELTFSFINHACMLIKAPKFNLISDPWIIGSSFCTGWFLKLRTNREYIKSILSSKYVYLSHSHPDHLNPISLSWLKSKGWNPTFIIPNYERKDITKPALISLGFNKIVELENKELYSFKEDKNSNIQMIMDLTERNDSGIIFYYKGHKILNLVDCNYPDIEGLKDIDIALISFANGASGYPVCWGSQYSKEEIKKTKIISNIKERDNLYSVSKQINSSLTIPFAGYFEEKLTEDQEIKHKNIKNSVEDIIDRKPSFLKTKIISPCKLYYEHLRGNGITLNFIDQQNDNSIGNKKWQEKYRDIFVKRYSNIKKQELTDFLSIQDFRDDLIVNFKIFNRDFSKEYWNACWDFRKNSEVVDQKNAVSLIDKNARLLNINVRSYALGYTLRNSLPWEEFSIGFQARFSRSPDFYNFKFWDYFQNCYSIYKPIYGDLITLWKESKDLQELFIDTYQLS